MNEQFEQVADRVHPNGRLVNVGELHGGVSARVFLLETVGPGDERRRLLVRQYGDRDLRQNPHVAALEYRLLELLKATGVPSPSVYYYDESCDLLPKPYIVVEYIDGASGLGNAGLEQAVSELAAVLVQIHGVTATAHDLSFLPMRTALVSAALANPPAKLDESLDEPLIREVLSSVWPLPDRNQPSLLHGDYWPGNAIWHEITLVGIIDWEDAAAGDPLSDLANARLELLWSSGFEAMKLLTDRYLAASPAVDQTDLPYWDLCAALRPAGRLASWSTDASAESRMRERHRHFVADALSAIG